MVVKTLNVESIDNDSVSTCGFLGSISVIILV